MKTCPKCFQNHDDEVEICDCGYQLLSISPNVIASRNHYVPKSIDSTAYSKYPSLRIISGYFEYIAWINLLGSFFIAILIFITYGSNNVIMALIPMAVISLWGVFAFIINKAIGEIIFVFIDIEENLRKIISINEKQEKK